MAVTPTSLKTLFPELSADCDSGRAQPFIDMAGRQINASVFGLQADDALHFLSAHLLTLANRKGGSPGAVTGKTVGPVSLQYAAAPRGKATTVYEQMFLDLLDTLHVTPVVVSA